MNLRRLCSLGATLMIGFATSAVAAPLIFVSSEKDDTLTIVDGATLAVGGMGQVKNVDHAEAPTSS